jgi:hypothetical protein
MSSFKLLRAEQPKQKSYELQKHWLIREGVAPVRSRNGIEKQEPDGSRDGDGCESRVEVVSESC